MQSDYPGRTMEQQPFDLYSRSRIDKRAFCSLSDTGGRNAELSKQWRQPSFGDRVVIKTRR